VSAAVLRRQAVVINFSIDTGLTRLLGVDKHVCELQLCMRDLAVQVLQPAPLRHMSGRSSNTL
jgi:hypothetical protein